MTYLLSDVSVSHVAGSALGDEASSLGSGAAAVRLVLVLSQPGQQEAVRQKAFPGQHDAAAAHLHTHTHSGNTFSPLQDSGQTF